MRPTVNFSIRRILRRILVARRRATASYTSPLTMDLSQVKVSGVRPFVSIHVAVYNEKRVVERLIRATTSQDWFVAPPIEPTRADLTDSAKSALNQRQSANYEVIIADDSTDETTEIAKETLISADWKLIKTDVSSVIAISSEAREKQSETEIATSSQDSTRNDELGEVQDSTRNDELGEVQDSTRNDDREAEIFIFTKPNAPTVKLIHRGNRSGFKGGALQKALEETNPRAEYIVILDADFVPYPDTITQFVKTFQVLTPISTDEKPISADPSTSLRTDSVKSANPPQSKTEIASSMTPRNDKGIVGSSIAAVQGYQWHVLNKSQNWVTRGVRTEYAGSYVIERSTEELYGGLKQIAGSVYAIRADVLRKFGWGTSITEDFELTLRLYEAGYKVVFTPYIQVPAEAVSTIKRLIRQRMRWAEGSSYNIKVMFARMLFGRWKETPSVIASEAMQSNGKIAASFDELRTRNDNQGRAWVPSPLTPREKLEFVYFAFYYLQAAFFVIGTFSWFISETVFNARLPFWTAAFGWSLVFTNLLALPLMNIVGMFLEESEERDYVGILSFIALSYIVVPFQAYAAIKGFLEREEGPWFRTPKTGLVTDTIKRMGLLHFAWPFGRPVAVHANELRMEIVQMNANISINSQNYNSLTNSRSSAFNLFGGRFAGLPVGSPIRPGRRFKFISKGVIAAILVFSMLVNYLAFVGDVLNMPEQNQLEAEQSGPTKLGESNLAASRPKEFVAQIEIIEVEESTKVSAEIDFLYRAYLDDDNLAMFGRARISADGEQISADNGVGVVRIVYAGGKFLQYDLPGIIGGPTASSTAVSYEIDKGLVTFGIEASRLKQEITIYSSNEVRSFLKNSNNDSSGKFSTSSNNNLEMSLTMSEDLSVRRQNEKGWQVVDESAKTTVFFLKFPTVTDINKAKGDVNMDISPIEPIATDPSTSLRTDSAKSAQISGIGDSYQVQLSLDSNFLEGAAYPITIGSSIQTNPSYPVFDIADARENDTSDYNFVVTVPGNRNKVGFNKKGANTVGYRIDTGDGLYNMEMAMRERSAAPASVEGGKITYDLGNMDVVFEVWTDRVKADYILKSKPNKNTIEFNLNQFSMIPVFCHPGVATTTIGSRDSIASLQNDNGGAQNGDCSEGSISLMGDDGYGNINNSEVFRLEIPSIRDGNGNEVPKDMATLSFSRDLIPDKLVPKYCVAQDETCKEPPGYYDRSGLITLTLDPNFLDTAVYPITIDPTTLDASARSNATAYGSQRHMVRMSNGTLVVGYMDSDSTSEFAISFDDGVSWSVGGGDVPTPTGANIAVATLTNEIHIVKEDATTVKYLPFGGDITFKTSSNTVEDQTQTNIGGATVTLDGSGAGATDVLTQSFDPTVTNIDEVEIYVGAKNGSGSDLNIEIRESKNSSREPDMATAALATCSIAVASVTAGAFNSCTFADTTIDAAKNYFIIVYSSNATSTNNITIEARQPSGTDYSGGYNLFAINWTAGNNTPTWGFNNHTQLILAADSNNRPSIIIDKNNFPAVSWSYETSGGGKNSAVRFSRAVADPQVGSNWECATAASCAYVKTTDCNTDVCGDHIQLETGKNSASHPVLVKAPSTAVNADELLIFLYWNNLGDLFAYDTQVSGADYDGWAKTTGAALVTTTVPADRNLSALAVDDGANQKIWVGWMFNDIDVETDLHLSSLNADDNAWDSSPPGSPAIDARNVSLSLAYDAQEEDIYVWMLNTSADSAIVFRKYAINGGAWDSADQVFDVPPSADDLIFPNLKEDNAPTTSPGPKLDLVYMEVDTAPVPDTYTVYYHTWHTKETRNYDNPASLPTTEALTITSADNNLSFFYDENEYDDTNSDNDVFVPASTSTTAAFVVHTFKATNANATDEIQITWRGKKVTEACGSGAAACTLQIYEWGKTGCTAGWDDLGTADTSTAAGTEFALTGTTTNTCYYSGTGDQDDHLGANSVAVRVQTDCSTNCNLQTDVITFVFVPEKVLWLLPLALFLPRIMARFNFRLADIRILTNVERMLTNRRGKYG